MSEHKYSFFFNIQISLLFWLLRGKCVAESVVIAAIRTEGSRVSPPPKPPLCPGRRQLFGFHAMRGGSPPKEVIRATPSFLSPSPRTAIMAALTVLTDRPLSQSSWHLVRLAHLFHIIRLYTPTLFWHLIPPINVITTSHNYPERHGDNSWEVFTSVWHLTSPTGTMDI